MSSSGRKLCKCDERPAADSVPLWHRWECPECGRVWVADEPAPQMLVTWIPSSEWAWLPTRKRTVGTRG